MTRSVLALLLPLFLLLVMPAWGWLDVRRLKRDGVTAALMQSYVTAIGAMWLLALLSALLVPAHVLWSPPTGLVFCLLCIATGSLLLSMVTHTLVDLRIFLLLPSGRSTTGAHV